MQYQYNDYILHCKKNGDYILRKHTTVVDVIYKHTVYFFVLVEGLPHIPSTAINRLFIPYLHIIIVNYLPKHAGLELNLRNIVNVLHETGFSDGHWEQLGQQLIEYDTLATFRTNRHGDCSLCLSDTISRWLNNDLDKSWEKLAEAVARVKEYGQATADCVKQKAGIVHKCMFYV